MSRTTVWLAGLVVGLAAGVLGFVTGGTDGGVVAVVAVGLASAIVFGLVRVVEALVDGPDRPQARAIVVGAVGLAGAVALSVSVLDLPVPVWAYLLGALLVGVVLGVTAGEPETGLWRATVAGGTGGALTVYLSIYESFTMQPELDGIVVLTGVVAPLALGLACGLGGAVGGLSRRSGVFPTEEIQ